MRKIYLLLFTILFTAAINAQVSVTATAGTPGPTAYTTLKGAFDAINAGTHQGDIAISLSGNTTETATAALNASGAGSALYTNVSVTATVPVTVSGSIVGGIIKLVGADNVTIDGRIGGTGRNITVSNTSTSASTAAIWITSTGVGAGATNNVIRNLEIACGITQNTSTSSTFGIILCSNNTSISTTSNSDDCDNNSFIANRIVRCRYGIVTRGTTTNLTQNTIVTDNIIGPSTFGADQIGKVGIFMQADQGAIVSRNTVQFVGGDFANTTGGADRVGIGIGQESWSMSPSTLTSNSYSVTANVIHDIIEERTFSAVGILLGTTGGGSATNNLVANNFLYNVRSNGTSGDQTVGLGISGGHSDKVVYNSIYMSGDVDPGSASASTNFGSGIRIANASGTTHQNLLLQNNSVFMDLSSSSTAANRYYAISGNSSAYSFGTGGENYNNYYINAANTQTQTGGLGTTSGNTLTTQFATLANWQTAYTAPQDANSIQSNPNHISASDLHIPVGSPNAGAGQTVAGVVFDIDGQLRDATVDIGGDDPTGVTPPANDMAAAIFINPVIGEAKSAVTPFSPEATFTNIGTNSQAGVTVRFRIVNSVAAEVYNNTQTIASIAGSGTSASVVFSSVTLPADTYTMFAKTELAGDGNTANDEISGTFTVIPPLAGTYTVGSGGNYPSLTNNGGIFQVLNQASASANVIINILSDLSGETGTHSLNELPAGINVLIQPSGAPRTITGSNTGALIKLNGADNVTINGSTTGATAAACLIGGDAAIRELTIQNTNTGTSACVISVQTGTNGAQGTTLKNLNIIGQDPTTTLIAVSVGGNTPGTTGADNDNTRIENCSVRRSIFGLYVAGTSTANQNTGTVITQNDMSATATDRVRRVGILVFNDDGAQVTYNNLGGIETNESADAIGIGMGTQGADATTTTAGGITNALVSHNKISGVASLSTTGFSAAGIAVAGFNTGANTLLNNMISGITAPSTSPDLVAGIYIIGATGSDTRVYHNTVSMSGDRGVVASQMPSYGIAITGTDPTIDLRNNIIHTTQIASGGGVNAKSYAVGMVTTTFANLTSNYNSFWSTGANDGGFRTGSLSTASGTDYATLALYAAATGKDANSLEADPIFVSATDLHLSNASGVNWCLNATGTTLASVTEDIDCQPRGVAPFGPDMGADEFTPTGFVVNNPAAVCSPSTVDLTAAAVTAGSTSGLTFTYWTDAAATTSLPTPNAVAASGTYYIKASDGTCSMILPVTVTVNTSPTLFTVTGGGNYCSGGAGLAIGLSGSETGVDYQLYNGASAVGSPVPGTGAVIGFGVQATAGTYTVVATNTTSSCTTTMTGSVTITVNPLPVQFSVTGGGSYCAGGAGVAIGLSNSESGVNYQLYNGASAVGSPVPGTGAAISFGNQTAAGTYTVEAVNATTTCSSSMTGSATVTINPVQAISSVVIQPTTCVSADGAINITVSGSSGPYTYSWSTGDGSGLVAGQEDQSGLTVGQYTVVVTDQTTGCTQTEVFNLSGPGGCAICPTVGAITTNPATVACQNTPVTLTASGLVSMGITYGINFKVSPVPLADPYTGGSVIATVNNAGLTGGGTTATTVVTPPDAGSFILYAVLTPVPVDPACRPYAGISVTVNPTPTVNTVSNQVICNNGATTPVTFTGAVPGTAYNWTNTLTSIGLAASGTGDIASFTATNTTNAPVTATVTVTPSTTTIVNNTVSQSFNYTGAVQTFTVPAGVTSITIDAYGAAGGTGAAGNSNSGATLGGAGGKGSKASGTLAVTPGQVLNIYVGGGGAIPTGGYNGGGTGGNANSGGGGGASDVRFPGTTAGDRILVAAGGGGGGRGGCESTNIINGGAGGDGDNNGANGTDAPTSGGFAGAGGGGTLVAGGAAGVGCGGFLGQPGVAGLANGTGGTGGAGQSCCCFSFGSVPGGGGGGGGYVGGGGGGGGSAGTAACSGNDKGAGGGGAGGSSYTGGVTAGAVTTGVQSGSGMVVISYTAATTTTTCTGTPTTFTYTVNPTPTVDAVSDAVVCNGSATAPVSFSGSVSGTVYNWTNNNTSIGLAASGSGNIASFTAVNTGATAVTATITVTPSYTNAGTTCTGTPISFTITVGPTPTVDAVSNQVVCNNGATAAVNFTGSLPGTTFSWTNTLTSIGLAASGTGNIPSFTATNTTNAPVTATVTVTPSLATGGTVSQSFNYTGAVQTFTVPAGVTSITIDAYGAEGGTGAAGNSNSGATLGGAGGKGSKASGTLAVTPGQVLNIYVGGGGAIPTGGYNGGGTGGNANSGGGGGASDVRFPGTTAGDRILVAAGGGGGGRGGCESTNIINGGAGGDGDNNGANGTDAPTSGGFAGAGGGGTLVAGGAAGVGCGGFLGQPGVAGLANGTGGTGGAGQSCCCFSFGSVPGGGGGGGGYVGGGGGGGGSAGTAACSGNDKGAGGGGAGGSSYTGGVTAGAVTTGVQSGNGMIVISYTAATTTCAGTPTTFTYTVNPTPNAVATPASQASCSGNAITTIALSGNVSGTTYNWTRDNTASVTGIAASGSGNISGTLTNTTSAPVTVTFTITPTANGCTGTPITATVVVNPIPNAVATPATQTVCTGTAITTIALTGNVSGTIYNWTRNNTTNVTGIAASGSGNISGTLTNTTTTQQTVTFTITPTANGCTGTAITATVIVNPTPTITCPANIVRNADPGICGAVVTYPPATATGTPTPTITYSVASGSTFPVGVTTVTATATNACGTVTCTFTVTVVDNQAPTITCPANIVRNTDAGSCTATFAPANPTTADNCAVTLLTWTMSGATTGSSPTTGINNLGSRTFNMGVTTVAYTVKDAAGNTSNCSFTVTINDGQLPVVSAQPVNRTVCAGTNATFSVTATNVVTYQWQQWNGTAWVNIAGANSSSYTVSSVTTAMNTNTFRVILNGLCTVVNSNAATLYVNPLPAITLDAATTASIWPNQTSTITATATPAGGTFVWTWNGAPVSGVNGAVLGPISIDRIGDYKVTYTDPNGCVNTSAVISITPAPSDNNLWVYPNPTTAQFNVRYYNQNGEKSTLRIYNAAGQVVFEQALSLGIAYSNTPVNLYHVAAGIYVVKVVDSEGRALAARSIVIYH